MAIALVQSTKFTGLTGSFGVATTAGNCVVVCVADDGNGSNAPAVTAVTLGGSAGNFSQLTSAGNAADGIATIWADPNCAGGQTAIAVTESNSNSPVVFIYEFSGVATSFVLDKFNSSNGTGSTWSSGATGTLTTANEVAIGVGQASGGSTITPPGSFTNQTQVNSSTHGAAGYQITSTTSSLTYNGTSAGFFWDAAIVTLVAASSGPPAFLNVTATGGGSSANGILLRVRVLDNAAFPTPVNGGTQTASASQAANVSLTPEATGSLAYSVVVAPTGTTPAAATGNTAIDTVNEHGTFVSTATLTANTPFTAGSTATPAKGGAAAVEVMPFGGTITTDASSPAVVNNTGSTTASTAAFAPPTGGKLLLALVSMEGGSGVAAMTVTDTHGLTWTNAAVADAAANHYAGIWYAYTPANLGFASIAPSGGTVGSAYSYMLTATGGWGYYTWSLASGSLPAGLTLASSTGVISGTPTTAGLSSFTVTVTDNFGNTATSGTISMVVNQNVTATGSIRAGWTAAAGQYTYGTLEIPVATTDHDWVFVVASWEDSEDSGIAYVSDDVHNAYQQCAFNGTGSVNTQVFAVPNARAASTVYVSTSAFARWLTVCVLDVTGLQPGFTIDASNTYTGSSTTFTESLTTAQPDFILAAGAFQGTPVTVTQAGAGATWNTLSWAGINGSTTDGITQSAAWAVTSGSATPSMQFTVGSSAAYSGCIVAVYKAGTLPVNTNPAWPVTKAYAAFGYTPNEPTAPPTWTDITSRYLGLQGTRGRNFELDQVSAADITATFDNFDGALSPGGSLGATLITPVLITKTWQGRISPVFRGIIHALPQTYDYQRGMVKMAISDDFSKLPQILLGTSMIQEMLYDKPLNLWPLNEQQGALTANNWSSRSVATLSQATASGGGGVIPSSTKQTVNFLGHTLPVATIPSWLSTAISAANSNSNGNTASAAPTPTAPTTGFGNTNSGAYPTGLAGTTDSVWGNSSITTTSSFFQGTVLQDSNDSTLPLTSTGSTYSVWAQFYFVPSNTNATIITLSDQLGTAGSHVYLNLTYNGTSITAAQTTGSHTFTPSSYLFDGKWHLYTVTISTGAVVTFYLDGVSLGSYTATMPASTPTLLQFGGDATATTAATAGMFTGCMALAANVDRVVDPERIASWYLSGSTGFAEELAGTRIQRVLAWARWSAPQAADPGVTKQQPFNYLTGGYGSNGVSGAIGNYSTAGGAAGIDSGAQADSTVQDIANTDLGFLFMSADGTLAFRERDRMPTSPALLGLGDLDYALNTWQAFESGLGPWTSTVSCTVAQSAGWSYAGHHSALVTVSNSTGTVTRGQKSGLAQVGGGSGTTITATWGTNPGAGNSILLFVQSGAPPLQPLTVVDNGTTPTTFTLDASNTTGGSSGLGVYIYRANNISLPAAGSYAVTVTDTSSRTIQAAGIEYIGLKTGPPDVTNVNQSAGSTAPSTGSATPATAGGVVFGGFADFTALNPETITFGGSAPQVEEFRNTNGSAWAAMAIADALTGSAQNFSWTLGDSVAWQGVVAAYSAGPTSSKAYAWGDKGTVVPSATVGFSCWVMSPQGCTVRPDIDFYTSGNSFISTSSGSSVNCPPMTPVFLNLAGVSVPGTAGLAYPHPTLVASPASGTQLYFDRARLSPAGFQCPFEDDVEITEDVQYLYNDVAITRNVDQATYRARDTVSRGKYYPRVYTRTIYSSVNDLNAVPNAATTLLTAFSTPALRVTKVLVKAAENPEAWPFVLTTEIGSLVSFTRTPVGGAPVTGNFLVLSVEPDLAPDKADFSYVLAPNGAF